MKNCEVNLLVAIPGILGCVPLVQTHHAGITSIRKCLATMARSVVRRARSVSRLEQFDRISVRILDLDLATTGTGFDLIAKMKSRLLQFSDEAWKI